MVKRIFQIASLAIMIFLWYEIWSEYVLTHSYYQWLLDDSSNRNIVVSGLLFSLLPWGYLVYAKKTKLLPLLMLFFIGLILFGVVFTTTKWWVGWSFTLLLNSALLFLLALFMFLALTSVWAVLKKRIFTLETETITDVLLSLWIGLSFFLLINYVLINLNLFFPWMSRLQVVWALCLMRRKKSEVHNLIGITQESFSTWSLNAAEKWWLLLLLCLSCLYLYLWFYLSDIAYSTAWDANHAYMFYPKMRALNNGYYRDEIGMRTGFQLWYAFIAFWFSLFTPTAGILWIAVDTIAISMNFWSGFFVILFWLWLLSKLLELIKSYDQEHTQHFWLLLMWWLLILLRLTSGMWAFLVFVDNKTDLWVLALLILAIWSGLIAVGSLKNQQWRVKKKKILSRNTEQSSTETVVWSANHWRRWLTRHQWMLILLSWFFFAIAAMAKQTALFDVANFGIFAFWLWIGPLGAIGVLLIIIGLMAIIRFRWIEGYLSASVGKIIWGAWVLSWLIQIFVTEWKSKKQYLWYLLVWLVSFLWIYLLFKVPFHAAKTVFFEEDTRPGKFIERVLFSQSPKDTGLKAYNQIPLFAQLWVSKDLVEECTLQGQWLSEVWWLYENLLSSPWDTYNEDVWRYVWFGRKWKEEDQKKNIKPFTNPWRWFLFGEWCSSFPTWDWFQAKVLCENEASRRSSSIEQVQEIQRLTDEYGTSASWLVSWLTQWWSLLTGDQYTRLIQELETLMQENSAKVEINSAGQKEISLPYKYLTIFNITFNRSLQNLSSYYTDIGMIRLILIIFSVVWLIYGVIAKNKILTALEVVTIFGWVLWFFIGWWILRYAIGIIVWSIMSFVAFMYAMTSWEDKQWFWWIFMGVFLIFAFMQLGYNVIRIASQWGSGPFMRYKSNTWITNSIDENLQPQREINSSFTAQDIFNLQFPHYNKLINAMNQSTEEEGAMIAWTYSRYFINDQSNIRYDQFLTWMWEMTSDGDLCSTYLRLKDQKKKYIVIDPNIWTVVQWSWNNSLFDRFFARVDKEKNEIIDDGVMTSVARMVEAWYLKYFSSNNLGAKYAYILPNTTFGTLDEDTRVLERAKLSVARFWGPSMMENIMTIAEQRIDDGSFLEDIADMTGKTIRISELREIISTGRVNPTSIQLLTQDERYVLLQYLNLRRAKQNNGETFQNELAKLIKSNIQSWSQIIVLEVQ